MRHRVQEPLYLVARKTYRRETAATLDIVLRSFQEEYSIIPEWFTELRNRR